MRSFDAVTTDRIRLSIDKFRDDAVPANIKSLKLYNEPKRNAEGFEVSAYQRLDGYVPTEILAKGDEYVRNYAKFYDVYSTVIVFAAVHWDENGNMNFGEMGGIMVFRVGCDRLMDDPNSVTGGIEDTLNRYVTGW